MKTMYFHACFCVGEKCIYPPFKLYWARLQLNVNGMKFNIFANPAFFL